MKNLMRGLACAIAAVLVMAWAGGASAQISTEKTLFTLTEPMDVGCTVLEPGTYRIKVVELSFNRNLVQVTNPEGSKVLAAVLATPHPIKADETIPESRFIYYPAVENQPKALRTWFAHDTPYGQDIIYPKHRAMELAAAARVPVVAIDDEVKEAEYKSVPLTVVTPEKQVTPYQEPAAPVQVAQAQPPAKHKRLPATASHVPLLALVGLVSLGGALGLRVLKS